jgi:hypothetical protein
VKVKGYGVLTPELVEILAPGIPHFNVLANVLTQYPKH